jgi:hypothetical protein
LKIEKNIQKRGNRFYVNIMRKGVDFSASFANIEDARHYLSEVRSIQHGGSVFDNLVLSHFYTK